MQIYTTQSVDLAQKPAAAWSIIHSSIPPKVPSLESGNEDKTIQEAFQAYTLSKSYCSTVRYQYFSPSLDEYLDVRKLNQNGYD